MVVWVQDKKMNSQAQRNCRVTRFLCTILQWWTCVQILCSHPRDTQFPCDHYCGLQAVCDSDGSMQGHQWWQTQNSLWHVDHEGSYVPGGPQGVGIKSLYLYEFCCKPKLLFNKFYLEKRKLNPIMLTVKCVWSCGFFFFSNRFLT